MFIFPPFGVGLINFVSPVIAPYIQLSVISTALIVEARPNANGQDWPDREATGGLGIEQDANDPRSSQFIVDDKRNEEKHESTGSGFVANALAAGVGTLLASGIANYGSNAGYPYASGNNKHVGVVTVNAFCY